MSGGRVGRRKDLEEAVDDIALVEFDERYARKVPTSTTVKLEDGAVWADAVYLYTDMADSTGMAEKLTAPTAARAIKAFLSTAARIIKQHDGEIRGYDGDRVLAIYLGDDAASNAAKTALEIKWAVDNIVHQSLYLLSEEYRNSMWVLSHRTGIDTGLALIVRAGVRDDNDLVSIGNAPNIAAKLSDLKGYRTTVTEAVWQKMSYRTCFSSKDDKAMWTTAASKDIGIGRNVMVRHSNWGWIIN